MLLDKNKIFITGILGILGSVLVGVGEFLLHFSLHIIGNADNYQFFNLYQKIV